MYKKNHAKIMINPIIGIKVTETDMSWHTLFKYGDSLIGFMLSAVYGTLVTPALVAKWSEEEDGMCKLCTDKLGTVPHILAGCPVALSQGRYRWRHDKVLKQIAEQVTFHYERRANKKKVPQSLGSPLSLFLLVEG